MTQSKIIRDREGEAFTQSRRLVARSNPEADESLYGWAVRLADANGYANAKAILSLAMASAGSSQIPLRDRLAHLVDGSPNHFEKYVALRARAKPCHCPELGLGLVYFDKRPKICPACLADRAILKSVWNLRNWAYCPQHNCKMIQACPFCHHSLSRGQHSVTHCGNRVCTGNLSNCSADPVPRDITNIVVMLGDVASGQRGTSFPELPENFNDTSLRDLIHLIDALSKPLLRDDIRLEDTALNRLKITEDALTAWPHGFRRYIRQLRSLPFDATPRMSFLVREFHNIFLTWNYRRSTIMDAVKAEFANYIEEHIPQATEARFKLTGKRSGRVTLQQIIREQRLSPTAVWTAQRKGLIHMTISSQSQMRARFVVERDHILTHIRTSDILTPAPAMRAQYNLASFEESARFLRVNRSTVKSLINAGYIETLSNHATTWCKYSSIDDLLTKLANVATRCPSNDKHGWSEFNCARSISNAAKLTDVLECALTKKLQIRVCGGKGRGLRRFLFKRADLIKLFPIVPHG
jgi:hypothetical protein